jgi:hypothetical protein
VDSGNVAPKSCTRQASAELPAAAKRLLLSCHLNLIFKKLRRGVSVEEREIVALLPFAVKDGWRSEGETGDQSNDVLVIDSSDEDWAQRLASAGAIG